jgi:predicted regulator of Ras-like GTPase activity (Roadblock/LC7/MglB family)
MVTEYRSDILLRTLRNLHQAIPGIGASVIVTLDGLLVAAYPPELSDAEEDPTGAPQVGAMAATAFGLAERTLERLAQGAVWRIMMEGENGVMAVLPAGGRAALAILVDKETKLGIALASAARTAVEVAEVLGD